MSRHIPKVANEEPEGCLASVQRLGLAAYVLLILGIAASAALCAIGTMHAIVANALDPHELVGGVSVEPWRTEEMRRRELLGDDELPDLYHDHSSLGDGSSGCMVLAGELVRWELWQVDGRVPIEGARVMVEGDSSAPTVTVTLGEDSVSCPFDEDEGGDRFERMLSAEAR